MTKNKGRCVYTIFEKKILCAGTMDKYCIIYRNELQETTINQNQSDNTKTVLFNMIGAIENINATARYAGVKMTANAPEGKSSHVVYIPFEQSIYELDINRLFIEVEMKRNRLFKMNKIADLNDQEEYLAIWCNETGFFDIEAAKG